MDSSWYLLNFVLLDLWAIIFLYYRASLVVQMVKNPPAIQDTQIRSLGQEDPLEKGMATHSSILAWTIPWTEESGGDSPWGWKESDTTEWLILISSTVLNRSGENRHPCLVPDLKEKHCSVSPLSTIFAMAFSYMTFIILM